MADLILVGGGARSGKSRYALTRAEQLGHNRVFVATAEAFDDEMRSRIARHQAERQLRFRTVECPIELPSAIRAERNCDVILVDCLTLWITNLLGQDRTNDEILEAVDDLAAAVSECVAPVIIVTNEVGLGLVSLHELGRRFQDLAGFSHQRLASKASEIYFAALGCVLRLKPAPLTVVS
jgi:adenosylcobinamide kinase/adenosylcobinamide-phosphate guanylyltransferase